MNLAHASSNEVTWRAEILPQHERVHTADALGCVAALSHRFRRRLGLYVFHDARALCRRGSGVYLYLPKLESFHEARLWNDVLSHCERALELPSGCIRATVTVESLPAAFEMDELLFELRGHSAGLCTLDTGREVTRQLVRALRHVEILRLAAAGQPRGTLPHSLNDASRLLDTIVCAPAPAEFLTVQAYEALLARGL